MRQSKATSLNNFADNVHRANPAPFFSRSQVDYLQRPSPATDDLSLASLQLTSLSPPKINLGKN
jgi:hypothetical protein